MEVVKSSGFMFVGLGFRPLIGIRGHCCMCIDGFAMNVFCGAMTVYDCG